MTLKGEWTYSDNAIAIYKRLYFDKLKGETRPDQTHSRIAKFIGNNDVEASKFFNLLENKIFRSNSPCMINAGSDSKNPHDRALSACYVLGLEDSMDSIIEMWGVCAKIYASGAGSGIPITNLREKGAGISTGGTASGPLAYLNVVDMLSNTVRSGGKTRRAANMGIFKYNHPDVMSILDAKLNGEIQTFNLSMSVTDYFIENINLVQIKTSTKEKRILFKSPQKSKKKLGRISIDKIWKKVIKNAWTNGDPGLFFYDTVNKFNPFPSLGDIDCTNPCGEIPLPPWSVCNIGSINVSHFVNKYDKNHIFSFNWNEFNKVTQDCFLFLDNVIDKQDYIHCNFQKNTKDWRPVGLGIMGFADALIKLNISYESQEAIEFFETLCYQLNKHAIIKSIEIAKDPDEWVIQIPNEDYKWFKNLLKHYTKNDKKILEDFKEYGIHNSNWTMIAPTGSTSMSADCSYAWEPLMALVWEKPLVESDEVLKIIHPQFEKDLEKLINDDQFHGRGFTKNEIIKDIIDNNGSIQNLPYFSDHFKSIYKVAHDIDPLFKIKMQGAGQKYISMAISSTTNLPNSATKQDVEDIYITAWKAGLKGITVFRDGCREDQIVHFGKQKVVKKEGIKQRPIKRDGSTVEIKTPHGKFYVTVNYYDDKPIEMFFSVGKQGGLVNVVIDALARICSKGLQAGMTMEWIVDTLEGLKGDIPFWFKIADGEEKQRQAESIVDALSKVLLYHFMPNEITNQNVNELNWTKTQEKMNHIDFVCEDTLLKRCPECGKKGLNHTSGCRGGECVLCGFSNCS
jgi:ribonucleoside-diphosphate reductase alpha chain